MAWNLVRRKMYLERTPEKLPDPKYWANVLNMVIMVLVLMRVLTRDEVDMGVEWAKAVLEEL
jgi:hypothetical protein